MNNLQWIVQEENHQSLAVLENARRESEFLVERGLRGPRSRRGRSILGKLIYQVVALNDGIRQPRPFLLWPNNFPSASSRDQSHLTPRSPPAVYFSATSIPYFFLRDYFSQKIQQRFINIARSRIYQIIG